MNVYPRIEKLDNYGNFAIILHFPSSFAVLLRNYQFQNTCDECELKNAIIYNKWKTLCY